VFCVNICLAILKNAIWGYVISIFLRNTFQFLLRKAKPMLIEMDIGWLFVEQAHRYVLLEI
jgi:hypothetical protein